jgi:hypothetical protein
MMAVCGGVVVELIFVCGSSDEMLVLHWFVPWFKLEMQFLHLVIFFMIIKGWFMLVCASPSSKMKN